MATTYLTRTQTTGNQRTFTVSVWVKRSETGTVSSTFMSHDRSGPRAEFKFYLNKIYMSWNPTGSTWYEYDTTALYRDCSGWYNIVCKVDTTESVDTDRLKIYVNGVSVAFSGTLPTLNFDTGWNVSGNVHAVGRYEAGANAYLDGVMSYVAFIDGTAYDASYFGQTDSDTGEWTINTSPSVTYGTNGFLILKNGNTITDQSGGSNDLTLAGGTLTNTEDCPADVFNTMNPLDDYYSAGTFSNGNTTYVTGTNATPNSSTIGVSKGKFYWEVKYVSKSAGLRYPMIGISSTQATATDQELGHFANDWAFYASNVTPYYRNNNTNTSYGTLYTEGDIVCVALDADNNKLYFRINDGSWENSGDPTSGATGTGAISITAPASTPLGAYFPTIGYYDSENGTFNANFGNGYFGTTAIASEGTNASNIGKFEYDVPTGYTALSTKGLQE